MAGNRIDELLPKGAELLHRLAMAEVLGPPPSAIRRRAQMQGQVRGPPPMPGRAARGSGTSSPGPEPEEG